MKSQSCINNAINNDENVTHQIVSILQMEETLLKQKIAYLQDVTDPGTTSEYEQGRQQLSDKLDTLRRSVKMDLVSRDDVTLRTRARFEQSLRATSMTEEEACLIQDYLRIEATMLTKSGEPVSDLHAALFDADESTRKQALLSIEEAFHMKESVIQPLFSRLVDLRQARATASGKIGYEELAFVELGRIDYTSQDVDHYATIIQSDFLPVKRRFQHEQQTFLGKQALHPWDVRQSAYTQIVHHMTGSETLFLDKAQSILESVHPYFADVLKEMRHTNHLDIAARSNKAGGGFCEYLPVEQQSFLFMNRIQTFDDLVIFMHEIGHAVHHDAMKETYDGLQTIPLEVGEFAAMSLELLTMNEWHKVIPNKKDVARAKLEQIRSIVEFLPETIIVDRFQSWLYAHPGHDPKVRHAYYADLRETFDTDVIDWSETPDWKGHAWMSVIHLFETPFYYIEYAIAQIAALQVYHRFTKDPDQTLKDFIAALALSQTHSIQDVYARAGVSFLPSDSELKELVAFLEGQIEFWTNELEKAY
ncbi:M3 family metallopeptidase [uncultured Exiguobacterium sp.]|uniref:M3 family metallopeptidase n=1 Tax=uncultured Exiguobacterium sp. TaxID=202669 RepID=UPI0025D45811|nr:M3 family metallopeptidase [uncultured Exiguobacterium sp.]